MILHKKQLIIIFSAVLVFLLVGLYFFIRLSQTVSVVPKIEWPVKVPPAPLAEEDKVLAGKILSEKPVPLPKTDAAMAQQVLSPESATKPLSGTEEAVAKKILGI